MAREFDSMPREPLNNDPLKNDTLRDDPVMRQRGTGMGMIGLLAGLAVAVVLGLMFWNTADNKNPTASNTSPGVTTGSSTTTPVSPPNTGPATPPVSR